MDPITANYIATFAKDHSLEKLPIHRQFEVLNDHVILYSHLDELDGVEEVSLGTDEFGIDGIAIIINGRLVFDKDEIAEILKFNKFLDVEYVFTQSKTSEHIDSGDVAKFLVAVADFFSKKPATLNSKAIKERRAVSDRIYENATKFRASKPRVNLYFCYSGKGTTLSPEATTTKNTLVDNIVDLDIFESVRFSIFDRSKIQDAFKKMNASVNAEIEINRVFSLPEIGSVKEAYLGLLPAKELLKLVRDSSGSLIKSVFYENIRDFDAKSEINAEIRKTISEGAGDLFALRNNGITILAPVLVKVGDKFSLSNYQIINGCQTSHVIESFDLPHLDGVFVPVKLVISDDDDVISSVIVASNQQNEVKGEQFWSLKKSQKEIEDFFQTYIANEKLFYERRRNQFASTPGIERTRIVSPAVLARQFAALFEGIPHIAGRYYREVVKLVEDGKIFSESHAPVAYYVAAYVSYRIEWMFRNAHFDSQWKPFRYHLLSAACRILAGPPPAATASKKLDDYAKKVTAAFTDLDTAKKTLESCAKVLETVIAAKKQYDMTRDTARLQTFRDDVIAEIDKNSKKAAKKEK